MYLGVKRLRVDGGHRVRAFPGQAKVFARRGVGRQRDDLLGIAARALDVLRKPLARGSRKSVGRDLRRVVHRAKCRKNAWPRKATRPLEYFEIFTAGGIVSFWD